MKILTVPPDFDYNCPIGFIAGQKIANFNCVDEGGVPHGKTEFIKVSAIESKVEWSGYVWIKI